MQHGRAPEMNKAAGIFHPIDPDADLAEGTPTSHTITPIQSLFRNIHEQTGCERSLQLIDEIPGLEGLGFGE